jgi:hypothetical protein
MVTGAVNIITALLMQRLQLITDSLPIRQINKALLTSFSETATM